MSEEFYSVIARTIAAVGEDKAQLRALIYHLARLELERELYRKYELGMQEELSSLEDAIARIEADVTNNTTLLTYSPDGTVTEDKDRGSEDTGTTALTSARRLAPLTNLDLPPLRVFGSEIGVAPSWSLRDIAQSESEAPPRPLPEHQSRLSWYMQLVAASLIGVAIYGVMTIRGDLPGRPVQQVRQEPLKDQQANGSASQTPKEANEKPTIDGVPLPGAYGVYAINRGKLTDLQLLPIRAPDLRVAISAVITTPSPMTLPDGQVKFVVFRRALMSDVPERVTVRVVARVMHALTFSAAGKASRGVVAGPWAVRSNAYDMRVAPVNGSPEMIVIRPNPPDFAFPAGRYALVLKGGEAYDFSVAGPIKDAAQCLERTDALNSPVYTECLSP